MDETVGAVKANRKNNIEIILKLIDGEKAKTSTGLIDRRLFTGEHTLHARMDSHGLWYLDYKFGILPAPLKQRFTNWNKLHNYIKDYFANRNIEIKEIID